jgi:hypothetical protein
MRPLRSADEEGQQEEGRFALLGLHELPRMQGHETVSIMTMLAPPATPPYRQFRPSRQYRVTVLSH